MGEKSEQKKQFIVETARRIFTEKGYHNVTMKDIVEACEISRGGLYLYFQSTAEVFMEVLELEQQNEETVFGSDVPETAAASDYILLFLREQKKQILNRNSGLTRATYEYFFQNKPAKRDNYLRRQLDASVDTLREIIEAGVENGEFYCEDPQKEARSILFTLEGLRISALTMGLSEGIIDRTLLHIMQTLVIED